MQPKRQRTAALQDASASSRRFVLPPGFGGRQSSAALASDVSRTMSSQVATFTFTAATLFGPGTISELAARLKQMGGRRPLVVTDPGLLETQAFKRVSQTL